ncbi:hypothetical protein ACTMU2_32920 [Cupriavidus basilensis]
MRSHLASLARSPVPAGPAQAGVPSPASASMPRRWRRSRLPRAISTSCRASRCTACWPAGTRPGYVVEA